ncbi:MAG: glycosyltransferase family 2 protein [Flavobacteriaceae bacterium]|nr:glycosyltransferase family 2 protein [Flavobacteriaceae bacterium]
MNLNKKIAIIIVNWKQYELTINCLLSLKKLEYKNWKVILVDNESNFEKINKIKSDFNKVEVIESKANLGFASANNLGIKYAIKNKFEYVMLLNNDTEVNKKFLSPLLNSFQNDNSLGAVQPLIMNYNNRAKVWNAGGYLNNFFGFPYTNKKLNNKNRQIDWITGCCILLKTKVIKKAGLIDEDFFAYYEDVDWSLRIKKLGYKLGVVESSVIFHHGTKSSNDSNLEGNLSPFVHYLNIRNHIYLVKKHSDKFNFIGVLLYQFLKILFYSIYFILRLRFSKLKMVYKGFNDGINNKQIKK